MGESSFKKICRSLAVTPEFKDYKKRFKAAVEQAKITGWEFLDRGKEKPPVIFTVEVAGFATLKISDPKDWNPPLYQIASDKSLLDEVARTNFGKKHCPTYNCKFSKVGDHWPDHAREEIRTEMITEVQAMVLRIRDEVMILQSDPKVAHERQEFHERVIVEAIKEVLLRYKDVADAKIYKLALDEFVAHEIMES